MEENLKLLDDLWQRYSRKLVKLEEDKPGKKTKRKKITSNSCDLIGLDRVKISIPRDKITKLEGCSHNIDRLNISDTIFSKLKSGEVKGNYYCHLDVNLPKVITGSNIKNVSSKNDFIKSIYLIKNRIKTVYKLEINLMECFFITLEINKNFNLSKDFTEYQGALFICAYEVINKRFKPMTPFIEPFSGIRGGKTNKKVRFYDKTYERICKELGDQIWFQRLTKSEIKEISRKYQSEARIEFYLNKDSLWTLIPKEITLGELSETFDTTIENVYLELLRQLGLDNESFEKRKKLKLSRMRSSFKAHKRKYKCNYISKFISNERELWGFEQVKQIIDLETENKNTARSYRMRAKKHFGDTGSRFGIKQDNWNELHEFVGKL